MSTDWHTKKKIVYGIGWKTNHRYSNFTESLCHLSDNFVHQIYRLYGLAFSQRFLHITEHELYFSKVFVMSTQYKNKFNGIDGSTMAVMENQDIRIWRPTKKLANILQCYLCLSLNILRISCPWTQDVNWTYTALKWSFSLRVSSLNVTKSAVFYGFGHIYRRNP